MTSTDRNGQEPTSEFSRLSELLVIAPYQGKVAVTRVDISLDTYRRGQRTVPSFIQWLIQEEACEKCQVPMG